LFLTPVLKQETGTFLLFRAAGTALLKFISLIRNVKGWVMCWTFCKARKWDLYFSGAGRETTGGAGRFIM